MKQIILIATFLMGQALWAYTLPITREGATIIRVAYPFWSGEYPSPVIDVQSHKRGTTTVKAYKELRELKDKVKCTIVNGLYHPWSKTKNSVINYYSLADLEAYVSLKDQTWAGESLKENDVISEVAYVGEGYCQALVKHTPPKDVEFTCDDLNDTVRFKKVTPSETPAKPFLEQWLRLDCKEGYKAFAQDLSLLSQPGIKEGEITGYGEVGPHKRHR